MSPSNKYQAVKALGSNEALEKQGRPMAGRLEDFFKAYFQVQETGLTHVKRAIREIRSDSECRSGFVIFWYISMTGRSCLAFTNLIVFFLA